MPNTKVLGFCLISVIALILSCKEEEACLLTADIAVVNIDAETKELTINPSGGLDPYVFYWTSHPVLSGTRTIQATKLGFPAGPGIYKATVVDKAGCSADASVNIEFDGPSCPFYLNIDTLRNGTSMIFSARALYGIKPYEYKWSTGSTDSLILVENPVGSYVVTVTSATGCEVIKESVLLAGKAGNPRFNLQFSNHENVDLDLYVRTPTGQVIFFGDHFGDGGEFDVDCKCEACPSGPTENIFWLPGTAPKGIYTIWVEYYGTCSGGNEESTYFLHRINVDQVEATYTGVLNMFITKSPDFIFDYQ